MYGSTFHLHFTSELRQTYLRYASDCCFEELARQSEAAAIVAPYAQDAVVCDLAPPLAHRGMDLQAKQAWLDTWEGPIDRETHDFSVVGSGDFAFCHGFYRLSGTPKAAGRPISFWMRATVCMHRDADTWRIVHEHESVPFYMDASLRPAFDLKP